MRRFLLLPLLLSSLMATAQPNADWARLRYYAESIGIDPLCDCEQPEVACVDQYFRQIVYGRTPRRVSFQGVAERIDTTRLRRLTRQFLAGDDWCPLLDSLESQDRHYKQLIAYCIRCLTDDYMADSLTMEQVQETLNTYRWLNRFAAPQRVVVNIPSATLRLIDRRGAVRLARKVVVGKPATPTPLMAATIPSVVMYPYWNVPRSITVKEMLPAIKRNPSVVLDQLNLQVIDGNGRVVDGATINWNVPAKAFPYRLRQSTGCDNALGLLKFHVNSPYDVYLHDTNVRRAFAWENRFLSHGCIRVEQPAELANALLGRTHFGPNYLNRCPVGAKPQTLYLPASVPVFTVYNLVDIDESGAIRVYKDIYGLWRGQRTLYAAGK